MVDGPCNCSYNVNAMHLPYIVISMHVCTMLTVTDIPKPWNQYCWIPRTLTFHNTHTPLSTINVSTEKITRCTIQALFCIPCQNIQSDQVDLCLLLCFNCSMGINKSFILKIHNRPIAILSGLKFVFSSIKYMLCCVVLPLNKYPKFITKLFYDSLGRMNVVHSVMLQNDVCENHSTKERRMHTSCMSIYP